MQILRYNKSNFSADCELFFLILLSILVFGFYGPVAEISSWQGVNYSTTIVTNFDHSTLFTTIWIIFYQIAFYLPVVITLLVRFKEGAQITLFQRVVFALLALLIVNYIIYIVWPTNAYVLFKQTKVVGSDLTDDITRWVFANIEAWCATPSLHIGLGWFFFRFFAAHYTKWWQRLLYLIWFVGMALGTLTLKVHILVDVLTGLITAEFFYYFMVMKMPESLFVRFNQKVGVRGKIILYAVLILPLALGLYVFWHTVGVHSIIN